MEFPVAGDIFQDKYRIVDMLGEGGFGAVYLANDIGLQRSVAIKILKPGYRGYDAQSKARFLREATVIANLNDPHTVTLFDFGSTESGLLYMVFEHLPGRDLSDLLHEAGRLPEPAAVHILQQLLLSLGEAHAEGILHRDLKPENVRVFEYMDDPIRVKLLDFGIAKSLSPGESAITATGGMIGTPRYMAPEHLLGAALSPSSDLYSLGLVTYEMLVGRDELTEGNTAQERLTRLSSGESLRLPATLRVSPHVRKIIDQMLETDANLRPRSAGDVLAALGRPVTMEAATAHGETLSFAPPSPMAAPSNVRPAPTTAAVAEPDRKTSPRVFVGAAAAALALGLIIVFALRTPEAAPPQRPADPNASLLSALREQPTTPSPAPSLRPQSEPVKRTSPANEQTEDEARALGCGEAPPFIGSGTPSRASWILHVPKSYDRNTPHPVVLLLHEDSQTATDFFDLTDLTSRADESGFVLIVPRDDAGPQAWKEPEDIDHVVRVLDAVAVDICIDRSRIFAVGHGAGGRAVEDLACKLPLAAMVTSGFVRQVGVESCKPVSPVPYLMFTGKQDQFSPWKGGKNCNPTATGPKQALKTKERLWADRNGCGALADTVKSTGGQCRTFRDCDTPVVSCLLDGGRRWPGFPIPAWTVWISYQKKCIGPENTFAMRDRLWQFLVNAPSSAPEPDSAVP